MREEEEWQRRGPFSREREKERFCERDLYLSVSDLFSAFLLRPTTPLGPLAADVITLQSNPVQSLREPGCASYFNPRPRRSPVANSLSATPPDCRFAPCVQLQATACYSRSGSAIDKDDKPGRAAIGWAPFFSVMAWTRSPSNKHKRKPSPRTPKQHTDPLARPHQLIFHS